MNANHQSFDDYTCRLCLSRNENNVDIFSVSAQHDELDLKIFKHLSIKVSLAEELPKCICERCLGELNSFHTFYTKTDQVQRHLKSLLAVKEGDLKNHLKNDVVNSPVDIRKEECSSPVKVRRSHRHKTKSISYVAFRSDDVKLEPIEEQEQAIGAEARIVEAVLSECSLTQDDLVISKDEDLSSLEDQDWIGPEFNFNSGDSNESENDGTWKPSNFLGVNVRRTRGRTSRTQQSSESGELKRQKKSRRFKKKDDDVNSDQTAGNGVENNEDSEGSSCTSEPQLKKLRITATHGTLPKPKMPPGSRKIVRARMNAMMMQFYGITCDICVSNGGKSQAPVELTKYQTFEALCDHMQKEHNERGYVKCCNCTMRERKRAERHMLLHVQPGSVYKCNICGKQLSSQQSFRCHILLHLPDSERPYRCTQCERGFVTKADLIQHEHQHLPEEKRFSFTCDICGSRFSYESGLMIHKQRVHENMRTHLCDICAKIFNSRCDMERHREQIHGNVKRELCPECGKWFKGPSILKTHMRQHRGVVYQCQFCEKKYSVRSSWKAHLLRHSDDKPHKCPMCEKSFKLPGTLKMHLNQHTGELPYACPFCPKRFASSGNYYTHRKRMHREEVAEMKKATEASLASSGLLPPATIPPPTVTQSISEAIARAKAKAAAKAVSVSHSSAKSSSTALHIVSNSVAETNVVQTTSVVPTSSLIPRGAVANQIGVALVNSVSHGNLSSMPTLVPFTSIGSMQTSGRVVDAPITTVPLAITSRNPSSAEVQMISTLPARLSSNLRVISSDVRELPVTSISTALHSGLHEVCSETLSGGDVHSLPLDSSLPPQDMHAMAQEVRSLGPAINSMHGAVH